ncbi:MAG: alpha-amylase family glycosyl hydrolase [Candidatus Electrothrix scaldis]|nr:MAG: alpha-amylase family glycosyl hydrolase [Candidatus Electrothrix sp. GW3-3]
MIELAQVGAHVGLTGRNSLQLGLYLPGISTDKHYSLYADIIHSADQFSPDIAAVSVELTERDRQTGLWQFHGDINALPQIGSLGQPGRYLYRYRLHRDGQELIYSFADPYAVLSGSGTNSAFDFQVQDDFQWTDSAFSVPDISELIIYEMMVDDFANTFEEVLEKLIYLESLGVNCIELMPVTNIPEPYRWGYMPMSYFAIEERYGDANMLKRLVNACHERGIAVIHDAVYAHMHDEFCYHKVYRITEEENPMIGPFAADVFGIGTDFTKEFTFDYFTAVNRYFLDELHFDGFRYDYVPGIYDGPLGKGYSRLVYETYQYSKGIPRFRGGTHTRIIQVAEHLDMPKKIMQETYTTASKRWNPMLKAQDMLRDYGSVPEEFIDEILLIDVSDPWPREYRNEKDGDVFPVAPLQFLESHDRSRLMYIASEAEPLSDGGFDLFGRDRRNWHRLQPFAIALMTAEGVPLLWQGQEFGEIYGKDDIGGSRVLAARPLHWNFFYEREGRALVNLYRRLGKLRHQYSALRSRNSIFYRQYSKLDKGLVAYLRLPEEQNETSVLVLINFSDQDGTLRVPLSSGRWQEQLMPDKEIIEVDNSGDYEVYLPSNYGKIFVRIS